MRYAQDVRVKLCKLAEYVVFNLGPRLNLGLHTQALIRQYFLTI
jgi:hypothetical protein